MTSNLFNVHIDAQMGKEAELENVEVSVFYPEPTRKTFADGGVTLITRNGTLSIKTGEFSGWYSAEVIFLTNKETGAESRYEVNRHNITPRVDGDWITFPVSAL